MERVLEVFRHAPAVRSVAPAASTGRPLAERFDEDVEVLQAALSTVQRHLHHTMTNALRVVCSEAGLRAMEGDDRACLYDALVNDYKGTERDLLIEVKTSDAPAFCRMAVGQLLDYWRHLTGRARTDLCGLLPVAQVRDARHFFRDVGVLVAWFNADRTAIVGEAVVASSAQARGFVGASTYRPRGSEANT